jgi:aspartate/methionine/tyrosine aminotransferase
MGRRSEYMEWAKTRSQARFNLAISGVTNVPGEEFPLPSAELEITGPGGYGYEPLQERIARHANVPKECIVAAGGTSMANHLAMAALLEAGDEVLIEKPAYGPLLDVAHYLGARVTRFERRVEASFEAVPEQIESAITPATRLIVLTNLHNPTGALIPAATLRQIGDLALRAGVRVLVDEVYLEMLFDGGAPHAFPIGAELASSAENPFVIASSLTKAYGLSGLRCGWIVAAPPLARRMWLLNDLFAANAAHAAEQLSVIAFDHLDRYRDRARALLAANRPLLDAFLDSRADLECHRPPEGSVFFPRLLRGEMGQLLTLLREKYETSVVPGEFFEMPQHFRIGISGNTDELRHGIERLSTALDELARSS